MRVPLDPGTAGRSSFLDINLLNPDLSQVNTRALTHSSLPQARPRRFPAIYNSRYRRIYPSAYWQRTHCLVLSTGSNGPISLHGGATFALKPSGRIEPS